MLTEREKRWLRGRELSPNPYCGWCMKYALCCSPLYNKCPTKTAYLGDALEFSERVAVKMAKEFGMIMAPLINRAPGDITSAFLRNVRLAVEEEMDNEP